jgi:hypothetical protein
MPNAKMKHKVSLLKTSDGDEELVGNYFTETTQLESYELR